MIGQDIGYRCTIEQATPQRHPWNGQDSGNQRPKRGVGQPLNPEATEHVSLNVSVAYGFCDRN